MSGQTSFNHGPAMNGFMADVQRTLVQEPGFKGIGGHGLDTHRGTHAPHTQTNIGLDGRTINFRSIK